MKTISSPLEIRSISKLALATLMAAGAFGLASCETRTGTGAAVGAGTGAVVAGPPGALVGAGVGAVTGATTEGSIRPKR